MKVDQVLEEKARRPLLADTPSRYAYVDLLRGFAALAVLICHYRWLYARSPGDWRTDIDRPVAEVIIDWKDPHFYVGCAYRREALAKVSGWDESQLIEDRDMFLRLSEHYTNHDISRRLVYYRRGSMTASSNVVFMTKGWDLFFAKHGARWGRQLRPRRAEVYRSAAALAVDQGQYRLAAGLLWRSLITNPKQTGIVRTGYYLARAALRSAARRK